MESYYLCTNSTLVNPNHRFMASCMMSCLNGVCKKLVGDVVKCKMIIMIRKKG